MSDDTTTNDATGRILALEEQAAHQARIIEDLSDQIAQQWTVIEMMRLKLDRFAERFSAIEDQAFEAPGNAPPPHY